MPLPDVREGITRFGSYESTPHAIELVPLCLTAHRRGMEQLIDRLKAGKYKYRGAARTFATRFSYSSVVTTERSDGLDGEVTRLLDEHLDWSGNDRLSNEYGKWEFYAGNTTAYDGGKRAEHLATIARTALVRLRQHHSLPAAPNLIFHHSVRISKDDYDAILAGVRTVAPDASVCFVWINSHNNVRLFDSRPETDGSLRRGQLRLRRPPSPVPLHDGV
jgi:hypothetical protein